MPPKTSLLHSKALWPSITKAARSKQAHVAVAYIGRDAPMHLPLKKGSILVCDFSISALERGLTHPDAIRDYLKTGVEIHSSPGLHAKVFSFEDVAFVGSCNASSNSVKVLTEAAIRTTDPTTIAEVSDFILSLRGTRIGPAFVKQMEKHYRPPTWGISPTTGRTRAKRPTPSIPLWVADVSEEATQEAEELAAKEQKSARKLLSDKKGFKLEWFEWNPRVPKSIKEQSGEIIMIHNDGTGPKVHPPARYLRSDDLPDSKSRIIWVEIPITAKPIPRAQAVKKLGREFGKLLKEIDVSSAIRNREFAQRLRQLW